MLDPTVNYSMRSSDPTESLLGFSSSIGISRTVDVTPVKNKDFRDAKLKKISQP